MLIAANEDSKVAVPRLISSAFLKKSELAEVECSAKEKQEFVDDMLERLNHPNKKGTSPLPDVASLADLHPYCVPGGDRVYRVGRGVKPPHARHTPDPKYAEAARAAKLQGTSVLLAVVTPLGATTAISIQRSLGSGLNDKLRTAGQQLDQRAIEAVSQWKFDPATFQGKPVAVVINVEVNFKLY
jgi:TonB family protein